VAEDTWNPWKMTAVGMMLVVAIAVVSGLVVASWGPKEGPTASSSSATAPRAAEPISRPPSRADADACNQYAKAQAGNKAIEVVKDGAISAVAGSTVGAAGGALADGGTGAGKGAAIGGIVGATAGTLYGLNETKRNDARYVEAYRACMKGRGFSS
jgi:uncharacterized protein YcfJ